MPPARPGTQARAVSACPSRGTSAPWHRLRGPIRPVETRTKESDMRGEPTGSKPEGARKLMGGIPLAGCTADRPRSYVKGSSGSMLSGPERW
ncbi:Uncharacterized protein M6B38_112890 [Iris pallida]|uniref:Uncharacterized protein n=1 Tax=Iris pallida TaxID=29817 RepID=A0AAX6DNJ1_IRIPA|nr:Uncharacterized protein M6B38_112890 [Iris pallida]